MTELQVEMMICGGGGDLCGKIYDGACGMGRVERVRYPYTHPPRVLSANRVELGFVFFFRLSNFTPPPPLYVVMGYGAVVATGLGFVCFVVLDRRVLPAA